MLKRLRELLVEQRERFSSNSDIMTYSSDFVNPTLCAYFGDILRIAGKI